jgi:N-methylhydantoinase B/oxoprolinase/acetone carboxylase alpha subunit
MARTLFANVPAGIGNLKVIAFSGLKDETHWVHMEIFEGSYGGRLGKDGMDAVDTLYANTRNNPIEDIETHLPLRVLRYELREDVAGAGKWRGGLGSVREFTFLSDGGASVEGEGHRYRPWGFLGGSEGMPAKLDLLAGGTTRAAVEGAAYEHRQRTGGSSATGRRAAATATRWSAIRRRWPMMCWMVSSRSRRRSGTMASWCRQRELSTASRSRRLARDVSAEVAAH